LACLCVVLLAAAAAGLWAQETVIQGGERPLRGKASPTLRLPISNSRPPIPDPQSSLLTPDALSQPLTVYYINRYASPSGVQWLNSVIRNGDIYLPYVREEIAKRNLPPELAYLPFIESGYIGTARSRSGAVGLWQFMMNSIPHGMKVNDMVDERRDFRKATVAALNKLEDNYRTLGNWPLALAAYNAGLGAVSRSAQRASTRDYWVLSSRGELKTETAHYVPKLLAVSYVLSRSRQFGIDYWPQAVAWTTIRPARQASLDLLAREAGADHNLLRRLNHELLHGITSLDKDYELKVPVSHADQIAGVLERGDMKLLLYYRYQIRYGDTLSALSRHYGVPIDLIEQHNPGIQRRYLQIGETILIPAYRETAPYTGSPAVPAPQVFAGGTFEGTHVVQQGDTLWSLAGRYGVDPQVLAAQNNMRFNDILSIGKVLKVPIME